VRRARCRRHAARGLVPLLLLWLGLWAGVASAAAQAVPPAAPPAAPSCRFLCAPSLLVEPTVTVEPLFRGGERKTVVELVFAVDLSTPAPWLGVTLEAAIAPFERATTNPFTGPGAGGGDIRDNPVQIESELNVIWLPESRTRGWVSSHADVVDQFSPASRPGDRSVYTHKLDFELDTAVHAFHRLPDGHWLRDVEVEASLDYLATGRPDGESGWALSLVLVIPVTNP
jgi:hypothetical protein